MHSGSSKPVNYDQREALIGYTLFKKFADILEQKFFTDKK